MSRRDGLLERAPGTAGLRHAACAGVGDAMARGRSASSSPSLLGGINAGRGAML